MSEIAAKVRRIFGSRGREGGSQRSGLNRFGRLGLGFLGVLSILTGTVALSITAATPAGAAGTYTCTTPASGGTSVTFYDGIANSESIVCYGTSGVSGTTAYPASITLASGSLPADATEATSTTSSPACTQSTSGSGTTEHYILTCPIAETPTAGDNGTYTGTFSANPGTDGGTAVISGALSLTVGALPAPTYTCTTPASGGTSVTWYDGSTAQTESPVCYGISGVSGVTAYPGSITLASGTLPSAATEATSTTSSPACTQSTSGSGTTEHYILTCPITDTPTSAQNGTYPVTFSANPGTDGGTASTSGTLTINVTAAAYTCTTPAAGGTSVTWYDGQAQSESVACYGVSGVSGTTAYPASITLNTGTLPSGATEATSTTSSPACTTSTSGSGATEEYILTCPIADTPTSAQNGTYTDTFTANPGTDGGNATTSGTLTLTVQTQNTVCTAPAAGGTSTTFTDGTASSYTVICYSQGYSASNLANYPASIAIASGTLPSDATFATSLTSSPACTTATSGSGTAEEYELECKISETPTASDNGTYHLTFQATGGSGAPNATSGTLTLTVSQAAPTQPDGLYFTAIENVPFCDDIAFTGAPMTSITAGAAPSGITNFSIQNVNLAAGTAQLCGTDTNAPLTTGSPGSMAPVATNSGGSVTASIPIDSQPECTWTAAGAGGTSVSMFDPNQDLEQAGSQSGFGSAISNGEVAGTSTNYPTCTGDVGEYNNTGSTGGSDLGGAFTINTANPLPSPTDTNPSASQGDLASSNLELAKGCYGATEVLKASAYSTFGSASVLTVPSPWVNGGDCSYGGLGSNSAGGNTDSFATCPPTQADVNEGYVNCSITASSGNDDNGSMNYTTEDLFFNGQAVPQQPTATLSTSGALTGGTVSLTGGSNWWGSSDGAPNTGPYGDFQAGAMYQVTAPGVYIGTSRATAVPVSNSTVTIPANTYVCTGAESDTVGPNPCTMTPGQPTGTFQVPAGLAPGAYNVYLDETNTTPLPGNGPNDAYQTARGTSLGTAESVTSLFVGPPVFTSAASTTFSETGAGTFSVTAQGEGMVTFSETGSLPSGVTLATNGTLSGTPALGSAGSYPITITATDGNGNTSTQAFTLTVTASGPTFTSAASTSFTENTAGTFSVTATGDTPITYSETGALPSGVTLGSDGTLAGTPAFGTAGSYPITITATDTNSNTATQAFTLTVAAGAPEFTSAASTSFTENTAGTFSVTANGDTPITYSETGPLPSGVTLGSDGTLAGTPASGTAGSYPITITATDTNSNTTTQSFTLTVTAAGPTFTSAASTSFAENTAGTFSVTASGDGPFTYSETGALPSGVTLGSDGTLAGTPAFGTAGSYPITITATDANSNTSTQAFTLTVTASGPTFTSAASTSFGENTAGTFSVTASGDTPITFSETGALPSSVTLGSDGTLAGTPAFGTAGSYPITITATDANSSTSTQAFTLTVTASGPTFTSAASTSFTENAAGTFSVTASGDTPISFSETGPLPTGVTLGSDGTLAGTPAFGTAGSYPITITATDANSSTSTQAFTLTVVTGGPTFTSAASTSFAENTAETFSVTASGDGPFTYSETGALPSGVTLGSDGTLAGTPAFGTAGSYPITITATDANSNTSTQAFTLTVTASPPVFTSASSISFAENTPGTFSVTATGDTPITYSETGALPSGVTLASNGTLAGTPALGTAGSYPITLTATDANSNTSTQAFTLTVGTSVPVFTSASSTTFTEHTAGSFSVTATGDTPISFSETGSLPTGVTLASNGTLAGTPAYGTAGSYPITITATDVNSNTTTQSFTLTVAAGAPTFTSASSTSFAESAPGTFSVTATGDTPITFSETGSLPSGVTLASNGTLAGTPAFGSAGSYPITITATDANAKTATQSFTLTVTGTGPTITSASSTTFAEHAAGTFSVTATGDTPISFSETGPLPSGVTLASSGTLAGTPAYGTAGSYPITITATDANSNTSTQSFTLTVTATGPTITSASSTTFTEHAAGTFSVTATGDGPFTYSETGALPSGVTLASSGTLAGTPAYGTAGSYPITITARDANSATTTQSFTLTVADGAPVFTSAASTSLAENTAGTFSVTATGDVPITFSKTGTLPSGVTLAANGTLSGTPAFGTAGSYPITITATDANAKTATQAFTLTVTATGPTINSASSATFTEGSPGTFSVTATGDAPFTFTETGALPSGVTLATNGTLSGTPTATGSFPITITAKDVNGNTSTQSFTLTVNGGPSTNVLVPAAGAAIRGTKTLDASATAPAGVKTVQFVITGGSYNKTVIGTATSSVYGYAYSWNTTTVPDGSYTLQSLVTDQANNTAYSTGISIIVDNTPPTTAVIVPASGAGLHGSTSLDASASDNISVASVQFVISGGSYNKTVIATASLTGYGYYSLWNTSSVPDGSYTLQSLATDEAGNTTYSTAVPVVVGNTPPTTSVSVPSNNASVSGTAATLDAAASDDVGIKSVQFVITGGAYTKAVVGTGAATYYGYIYQWNTTTVPDGSYTLQSLATDNAGNTTYSSGITIKVTN